MTKKLIIFDCDGVLVDSEYVASRVFAEALVSYGCQINTEESIKKFTGITTSDARQLILKDFQINLPENYWTLQEPKLFEAYESELTSLMRPVLEILDTLNFPRCVASNSNRSHVINCLNISEQLKYFSERTIFTCHQVKKPKPAPDLFLFAAKEMGFSPEDCIVIEDSPTGTQAAIAAGMDVIIFLGGTHTRYDWYKDNLAIYNKPMVSSCEELSDAIYQAINMVPV